MSPIEPTRAAAASLKMSPNMLLHSITSNCDGFSVNCIAALSTYICSSFTEGYTAFMAVTVRRQSCELVRTLALSTEHSRRVRSEEHTSELQSLTNLVCRLLLEKKT